jgi:hypothetical protein
MLPKFLGSVCNNNNNNNNKIITNDFIMYFMTDAWYPPHRFLKDYHLK